MANLHYFSCNSFQVNSIAGSTGTRSNTSLNTNYSHKGGAGSNAIGVRFFAPVAKPIDTLYIFMDAFTGTLGNISMECTIYNESTTSTVPSTTVRATSTSCTMPDAADKWIKFTFGTPYTPSIGEILWFVCYNMAADQTTDYPQILTNNQLTISQSTNPGAVYNTIFNIFTTTTGFNSGSVATTSQAVIDQNGVISGTPFTTYASSSYVSNSFKRGIVVEPMTAPLLIAGISWNVVAEFSGVQVFMGDASPDSVPVATWSLGTDENELTDLSFGYKLFDNLFLMRARTKYRWVFTVSSGSTGPGSAQIEDYSSYSSVFDNFYVNNLGLCYTTIANATGWTDSKVYSPAISLVIADQPINSLTIG